MVEQIIARRPDLGRTAAGRRRPGADRRPGPAGRGLLAHRSDARRTGLAVPLRAQRHQADRRTYGRYRAGRGAPPRPGRGAGVFRRPRLQDHRLARTICALADDSDPQAPIPRRFQNAILAVAARPGALNVATERAKRLLAAEAIGREHRTDDQILKRPEAQAALRVVQRRGGKAAIVYRRRLASDAQEDLAERLDRVAAVSPLAYTAGARLLREAVRAAEGPKAQLRSGPFHALDADWGARVACYALVASGLKNAGGLGRAAENLRLSDGAEAAWWFGLLDDGRALRAVRALRILVEAVA